jgi:hypothetical protein
MQQNTDFITADFLYMFRASSAHHQEYPHSAIIWRSEDPHATITTCTGGCRVSIYTPDDGHLMPETCRASLQ